MSTRMAVDPRLFWRGETSVQDNLGGLLGNALNRAAENISNRMQTRRDEAEKGWMSREEYDEAARGIVDDETREQEGRSAQAAEAVSDTWKMAPNATGVPAGDFGNWRDEFVRASAPAPEMPQGFNQRPVAPSGPTGGLRQQTSDETAWRAQLDQQLNRQSQVGQRGLYAQTIGALANADTLPQARSAAAAPWSKKMVLGGPMLERMRVLSELSRAGVDPRTGITSQLAPNVLAADVSREREAGLSEYRGATTYNAGRRIEQGDRRLDVQEEQGNRRLTLQEQQAAYSRDMAGMRLDLDWFKANTDRILGAGNLDARNRGIDNDVQARIDRMTQAAQRMASTSNDDQVRVALGMMTQGRQMMKDAKNYFGGIGETPQERKAYADGFEIFNRGVALMAGPNDKALDPIPQWER